MERDDFSRIAAPTYAKGFIKLYADYLGLDPGPAAGGLYRASPGGRPAARGGAQGRREQPGPTPAAPGKKGVPRWIDVLPLRRVAERVALGVAGLVAMVLLLSGLIKLVGAARQNEDASDAGREPATADWTRIAEPPDPCCPCLTTVTAHHEPAQRPHPQPAGHGLRPAVPVDHLLPVDQDPGPDRVRRGRASPTTSTGTWPATATGSRPSGN